MLKTLQIFAVLSFLLVYAPLTYADAQSFRDLFIPDIEQTVGSGPASGGQQGTTINIAPNISALFPEIGASGFPQAINLSEYEVTMTGGTLDDLFSEWEYREQRQNTPTQPTQPTFQTVGFPWTQSGVYGQVSSPFGAQDLSAGVFQTGFGATGLTTGQSQGASALSATGSFGTSSALPATVYPWMNSYWTATQAVPAGQTYTDPQFPSLGATVDVGAVGGVGWY